MIKRKRFAKILTSLLAFSLIFCSLFTLSACTTYTSYWEEDGGILFGYSEYKNEAFIGDYFWRGHLGEDMDIVLPNTYKDAPVTALGGYHGTGVPTPFAIHFEGTDDLNKELFGDVDGKYHSINREIKGNTQDEIYSEVKAQLEYYHDITKDFEIKDVVFNLHIGSNLQKIELMRGEYTKDKTQELKFLENEEDELITVYAFCFEITVDKENKYFYSDELGRMYDKETNNLVQCFLYHNRNTFPEHSL